MGSNEWFQINTRSPVDGRTVAASDPSSQFCRARCKYNVIRSEYEANGTLCKFPRSFNASVVDISKFQNAQDLRFKQAEKMGSFGMNSVTITS